MEKKLLKWKLSSIRNITTHEKIQFYCLLNVYKTVHEYQRQYCVFINNLHILKIILIKSAITIPLFLSTEDDFSKLSSFFPLLNSSNRFA